MPSFLHFKPSTTNVAALAVGIIFCIDVSLGFVGPTTPFHRQKTPRFKHELFVSSIPCTPYGCDALLPDMSLKTLAPLNFENDIQDLIDMERPYYALENEFSVQHHCSMRDAVGESVGFVCTVKKETSASKQNSVSVSEVVQHSTAAASVAVALMNPTKDGHGFRYRATKYSLEVRPAEGTIHRELSSVLNSANEIHFPTGSNPDECTIYCRSNEDAVAEVYFETNDKLYYLDIEFSITKV